MIKLMSAAAALALIAGSAATAATLTGTEAERIRLLVPGADLSALSPEQAALLSVAANKDDLGRNPSDVKYLRAVLDGAFEAEVPMLSANDAEKVLNMMPDADLSALSAAQVREISTLVNAAEFGRNPADAERLRMILMG